MVFSYSSYFITNCVDKRVTVCWIVDLSGIELSQGLKGKKYSKDADKAIMIKSCNQRKAYLMRGK